MNNYESGDDFKSSPDFFSYSLKIILSLFLLSLFITTACAPKKSSITKGQVMQERIDNKLASWRKSFEDKCKRDILELATEIVDSTLIANARAKKDTVGRPDKPLKPNDPNFIPPKDSIPIAPLINKETDSISINENK